MEMELKKGLKTEDGRKELIEEWGIPLEELEKLQHDLKLRRNFYRILRKEARELAEESTENSNKEEVSQINKENPNNG